MRSSNTNIATVDTATVMDNVLSNNAGSPQSIVVAFVTGVGNGKVTIYDSIVDACGTNVDSVILAVGAPIVNPLTGSTTICTIGDTIKLGVVVYGDTAYMWSSNNPGVATVDTNGVGNCARLWYRNYYIHCI